MSAGNEGAKDTGRRRDANAARVRSAAADRFAGVQRLHFYTFPVHLPAGTPLHGAAASQAARLMSETLFGRHAARWKLERGRGGALHLHAVSGLPPAAVVGFDDVRPVWSLRRLLAYFAKPADARLCRPRMTPHTPDSATRAREYRDALTEQAHARAGRRAQGFSRLPAVCGWTGRRAVPSVALLRLCCAIACALLLLAYLLARSALLSGRPVRVPARRSAVPSAARLRFAAPGRPRAPDRTLRGSAY